MTNIHEPYPDDGEQIEDPLDADPELDRDLQLIGRYLSSELTADETAAVEQRLGDDDGFWERVHVILEIEAATNFYGIRYTGAHQRSPAVAPIPVQASTTAHANPAWDTRQPVVVYPGETWLHRAWYAIWSPLTAVAAALAVATVGAGVYLTERAIQLEHAATQPTHLAADEIARGRALTVGFGADSVDSTTLVETRVFALASGSSALLRPGATFTYRSRGDAFSDLHHAAFDGEGVFTFRHPWMVIVAQGRLDFAPGVYAVWSDTAGTELRVSVGSGDAVYHPLLGGVDSVVVTRGEYLLVPHHGRPVTTTSSEGFPSLIETPHPPTHPTPLPPGE